MAIERAVGAIMLTNECTEDEARHVLDSATAHRNVSRREVAETILRALVVPDDGPRTAAEIAEGWRAAPESPES